MKYGRMIISVKLWIEDGRWCTEKVIIKYFTHINATEYSALYAYHICKSFKNVFEEWPRGSEMQTFDMFNFLRGWNWAGVDKP
jgi:hypothetical protein